MYPERTPHPVREIAAAIENGRRICEPRGYHGPFINGEYYDAQAEIAWHGLGECVHCRRTVSRVREERRRALALAGFRQVLSLGAPDERLPQQAPPQSPSAAIGD